VFAARVADGAGLRIVRFMCVRYTLHKNDAALAAIAQALAQKLAPPEWAKPKYNVTLTNITPVVASGDGGAEVRGMMWGIVPAFARKNEGMRMFPNAMAEKALKSPAWRSAVAVEKLPETFAILTTEPNEIVKPYHHRMPVLLTKETMPRWLGGEPLEPDEYAALTRPLDSERMTQREVNRYVNKSGNEGPECLAPPEPRVKTAKPAAPQLDLEL
jgi:putative SOS response-associated peptidase YedK